MSIAKDATRFRYSISIFDIYFLISKKVNNNLALSLSILNLLSTRYIE